MRIWIVAFVLISQAAAAQATREPIQIIPLRPGQAAPEVVAPPAAPARPAGSGVEGANRSIVPPGTPAIDPILRPSVLQGPRGLQPDGRFIVTREMCRDQVGHTPAPDVAYRGGVDAMGRPVRPADLPGGSGYDGIADRITTGILVDPTRRPPVLGVPSRGEAVVGRVEVDTRTGTAILNGRPITGGTEYGIDAATLAQLCGQLR